MRIQRTVLLASAVCIFTGCFLNPNPSEFEQKTGKGDELFASGDIDGAVAEWEDALQCGKAAGLYEKLVMAQVIKSDLDEAKKWVDEGLTHFPNNANLVFNNALINFHKEDFKSAMENADNVLEMNGYYPHAHFLKGLIYEKTGDKASARKEFVNEININPGSKGAWQKLRGLTND